MIRLPVNNTWSQPNNSDKFGSLWATKNINLDEEGYIKLSPRSVTVMDETGYEVNGAFGLPLAIGRTGSGDYQIVTSSDAAFNASMDAQQRTFSENDGTANPTLTTASHGIFWNNLWHATTADALLTKSATDGSNATWTSQKTGLGAYRHYLEVFKSRNQLCVTAGNVVKQYDTSYNTTQDLTLPSDFEAIGLAYNNELMGIITRGSTSNSGQNSNAFFFIWDGGTASADAGYDTGADACVAIAPYKSSFVILTRNGQLLYFNGGGFDQIAAFPFYYEDKQLGGLTSNITFGDTMVVDGDVIYINVGFGLMSGFGRKQEEQLPHCQGGVWCYDPKIGLYHRWSPSISHAYVNHVDGGDINTSTNTLTISAGVYGVQTIPATGGIARLTDTVGIGGLEEGHDYFIIKVSSTEFKLATTKENALNGTAIDITSATAGANYFWMFDIVDYGTTFFENAAGVALVGETSNFAQDIIFGGDYETVASAANDTLCAVMPYLENRGWAITPKIFSQNAEDIVQKLYIRYRPLKTGDAIIVKVRTENVDGLPVSVPSALDTEMTWTSDREFYTTADLSEAKTYIDAGGSLECEITSGAGGGQMSQVSEINYDSGTYSIVLEDSIIGASSGRLSTFIIDNWKVCDTIDENGQGYKEVPIATTSKWVQFKFELRGDRTTIEMLDIIDSQHKPNN